MSLQNAVENLQELAEAIEAQPPEVDENLSCCLECPDGLVLNFIYDDSGDALYIYLPMLEGLPQDIGKKAELYERLLEYSLKLGRRQLGTIGIDLENDRLMFYAYIDVKEPGKESLVDLLPEFMDMANLWKEVIERVS